MRKLSEEFQVHDVLNPKLWKDDTLIPEVREKVLEIISNFEEYLEVPVHVVDIVIVGSNASYNYTDHSDLDIHLIVNTDLMKDIPEDFLKILFNMKKTSFNKEYDIQIKGIPVEMYVEDLRSTVVSNGIYSICDNRWVKEPSKITNIPHNNVEEDVQEWQDKIDYAVGTGVYEDLSSVLDKLYLMRKNSIAIEGEYGKGNEIFKTLRDKGYLSKLKEALNRCISSKLSLESYIYTGKFINLFEE